MIIPRISVAMATYNGEQFIREQLDSFLAQTISIYEVVVTDDCSTDKTVEILNEYSSKLPLKIYRNPDNLGYCRNFERAISLCSGDYIALSDQDDVWMSHKLETLIKNIGDNDLICSDAELVDENLSLLHSSFSDYAGMNIINNNDMKPFLENYFVTGCTALFRSNLKSRSLPFPMGVKHHDFWLAFAALKGDGLIYLKESLIKYRQHGRNQLGAGHENKKRSGVIRSLLDRFSVNINRGNRSEFLLSLEKTHIPNLESILSSSLLKGDEESRRYIELLLKYYNSLFDTTISLKPIFLILFGASKTRLIRPFEKLLRYLLYSGMGQLGLIKKRGSKSL